MEAIKNLRESSVLLSSVWCSSYAELAMALWSPVANIVLDGLEYNGTNGNIDDIKRAVDRCAKGCIADYLADIVKAHATDIEYRALFDGLVAFDSQKYDTFVDAEERGEIGYDVPEEEQKSELSATMSNLNDASEEKKERVLTPEEEEATYDAWYEAEFGNCPCLVIPEKEEEASPRLYRHLAKTIYSFEAASVYAFDKPSADLDIKHIKEAVLRCAEETGGKEQAELLAAESNDTDYRAIYRELYILLRNDIADIDEDIYLHDAVPYSIKMRDGHRVVCPHFEWIIEADEIKEGAFFDDDFDLVLDEETGKVEMCRDHLRLTEEDYEEMERLEADDSYDPSLYEADRLPF